MQRRAIQFIKASLFFGLFIASICSISHVIALAPSSNAQNSVSSVPNQSARFNSEGRSFDFFATLLIWTAREIGSDCWAEVITSEGSVASNVLRQVDFGWDPGFRVGFDYGMKYDQWDTQAYFTWFHTHGNDHVSSTPGSVFSTFMGNFYVDNPTGAGIHGPSYQSARINWTIHFNMLDWELGRNYWVSQSLALRPFLGIKGGWINQSIDSRWYNPALSGAEFFNKGQENVKNNFWGIGPAAGVNTKWTLLARPCHLFYLFGDFSGALMWGHWSFSDIFKNNISQKVTVDLQHINSAATMVRTFMGFGWNMDLNENQYRFSARLGYEAQFWLDQLQFYSFVGGRLDTALTLQGGALEFSFDF